MTNVLNTIKKLIGIPAMDTSFDIDLVIYINTCLVILNQLGLSDLGLATTIDEDTSWADITAGRPELDIIKTYICHKTKLMFDPPTSNVLLQSMTKVIDELEWRIANVTIGEGGDNNAEPDI